MNEKYTNIVKKQKIILILILLVSVIIGFVTIVGYKNTFDATNKIGNTILFYLNLFAGYSVMICFIFFLFSFANGVKETLFPCCKITTVHTLFKIKIFINDHYVGRMFILRGGGLGGDTIFHLDDGNEIVFCLQEHHIMVFVNPNGNSYSKKVI